MVHVVHLGSLTLALQKPSLGCSLKMNNSRNRSLKMKHTETFPPLSHMYPEVLLQCLSATGTNAGGGSFI